MIRTMFQHAKKHPGLIPQFFFLTLGITGASLYLIRLARGPHVTLWDKKNNPEPWTKLDPTYQYKRKRGFSEGFQGRVACQWNESRCRQKFVAVNTDYKNLKKEGPDF
ncbi:cytochrome c oxidase subunit NDUFA4 isoform 1-T1 [Tautogolabrus adspersus]